jgi:hypothetical protein
MTGDRERAYPCTKNALVVLALLLAPAVGTNEEKQGAEIRIPVLNRPAEHFYDAVGTQVRVRMEAKPTELLMDEWCTLTLTISGLQNSRTVQRPDLNQLDEFAKRFQIEDLPPIPDNSADRKVFAYKLRPRGMTVTEVPPLRFYYFNPKAPPDVPRLAFPFTASESISIRVKPAQAPPPRQIGPLDVPAFAEQLATSDRMNASPDMKRERWLWPVVVLGPLLAACWVLIWRACYPDEARRAQHRQSRAARRALAQLDRLRRRDSAGAGRAVAAVVLGYLHERVELPLWAQTPADVSDQLARAGVPKDAVVAARDTLRACDEVRFAPAPPGEREPLLAGARRLITLLEGDA